MLRLSGQIRRKTSLSLASVSGNRRRHPRLYEPVPKKSIRCTSDGTALRGGLFFIWKIRYILMIVKTFVVYKTESDHARDVLTFLSDFTRQTGRTITEVDPDSRDGASMCRTYDIVEYPSIVAVDDNGVLQTIWRGLPLPTVSEVSYYASQS